jgi:hypothetical protein
MAKKTAKNPLGLTKKQLAKSRTEQARIKKAEKQSMAGSATGANTVDDGEGTDDGEDESVQRDGPASRPAPERASVSDAAAEEAIRQQQDAQRKQEDEDALNSQPGTPRNAHDEEVSSLRVPLVESSLTNFLQHFTDPETSGKRPGKGKSSANSNGKRKRDASEEERARDPTEAGANDPGDDEDDPNYQPQFDQDPGEDNGDLGGDGTADAGKQPSKKTAPKKPKGPATPEDEEYPSKAAAQAARAMRAAAVAGPTLPEAKAIPSELTSDEEVRAEIESKSLIKETLEMKQNLAPIWVMCEKCVLYIQHGTYTASIR